MRRNLSGIHSLLVALRRRSCYIKPELPFRYLSRNPINSTNSSVFKAPNLISASFASSTYNHGECLSDVEKECESDDKDEVVGKSGDSCSDLGLSATVDILQTPGVQEKSKKLEQCEHGERHSDMEYGFDSDADDEVVGKIGDSCCELGLNVIVDILQTPGVQEKRKKLEQCGVSVTPGLVANVLSMTRNDWETAFTFFLWAQKQPGYKHSRREYHSMIAILGKFRKFDTAWSLIDDMRAASLVTPQSILIMIRKYAAVHDVAKAINAFYGLKRFGFEIGMEEFQGLLSALCRYKNVKDAEHLLFCNKTVFPLSTKSFNIILNGWCNVIGDIRQGKRIWREMETRGIRHDVYSYASIMSCFSKVNSLNMVLRFYEKMKALGIRPDRKVYNAVIHALAKGRLVEQARSLMETMEEAGCTPDTVTYNSLIMPLCKSRLLNEAKEVFDEMMERGLLPTVRTYHGLFRCLRTAEEVFELLERMRSTGCHPSHDTYIMLIRKFCRWRQLENVFKLWGEMSKDGLDPDRSSYIVLIHGLFLNGRLEEAHKYYLEMKEKDLLPEPKIDAMLQEWLASKREMQTAR